MSSPDHLHVPDTLHPLIWPGGATILDLERERFRSLDSGGARLLQIVNGLGALSKVCDYHVEAFPDTPPEEIVAAVTGKLQEMTASGYLAAGEGEQRVFNLVTEYQPAGIEADSCRVGAERMTLSLGQHYQGFRALRAANKVKGKPMTTWSDRMAAIRSVATRDATHDEALESRAAIRQMRDSAVHLSSNLRRIACLEESMATVVFGSWSMGVAIDMHIGTGFDPLAAHAWTAAEGQAIEFADDPQISERFHSIYQL